MESFGKGIQIGPTIQQAGVQTIQQAIYLAHGNPCGMNRILFGKIGKTNLRLIEFIELLNCILIDPDVQQFRMLVVVAVDVYGNNPSEENFLKYLKALSDYAQACNTKVQNLPPIERLPIPF